MAGVQLASTLKPKFIACPGGAIVFAQVQPLPMYTAGMLLARYHEMRETTLPLGLHKLGRRAAGGPSTLLVPPLSMPLSEKDKCLTRLYMAACFHHWDLLAGRALVRIRRCSSESVTVASCHDGAVWRDQASDWSHPELNPSLACTAELGQNSYKAGCTIEEVRGCVRHLIVCAAVHRCCSPY